MVTDPTRQKKNRTRYSSPLQDVNLQRMNWNAYPQTARFVENCGLTSAADTPEFRAIYEQAKLTFIQEGGHPSDFSRQRLKVFYSGAINGSTVFKIWDTTSLVGVGIGNPNVLDKRAAIPDQRAKKYLISPSANNFMNMIPRPRSLDTER